MSRIVNDFAFTQFFDFSNYFFVRSLEFLCQIVYFVLFRTIEILFVFVHKTTPFHLYLHYITQNKIFKITKEKSGGYENNISRGDVMEQDSLFYFNNPTEFKLFLQKLDIYNDWKIRSGRLNDRGKEIENKPYTKFLRESFQEKGFFRMRVSIAEIISWLDTVSIMKRLFDKLEKQLSSIEFNRIELSIEYMIQMSKRMRVDYLIIYKNRILLLEFRTVSQFEKIRPTWDYKFKELIQYKELMSYYLFDQLIRVYAFIPLYEYNGKILNSKNIAYNNNQIDFLAEFIKKYLID